MATIDGNSKPAPQFFPDTAKLLRTFFGNLALVPIRLIVW